MIILEVGGENGRKRPPNLEIDFDFDSVVTAGDAKPSRRKKKTINCLGCGYDFVLFLLQLLLLPLLLPLLFLLFLFLACGP